MCSYVKYEITPQTLVVGLRVAPPGSPATARGEGGGLAYDPYSFPVFLVLKYCGVFTCILVLSTALFLPVFLVLKYCGVFIATLYLH